MKKECVNGHIFEKTSQCPVCPICKKLKNTNLFFIPNLAAPARRALENEKIESLEILAQFSEKELLKLHGLGKSSIPKIKAALAIAGLSLKIKNQHG
jgi:DNA-directed RNA polymerase alpha subunit